MTDDPNDRPSGEALPVSVVSTRLDLRGPTDEVLSRACGRLWSMIDADNDLFDRDQQKSEEDTEEKLTVLRRKPFPQGTLLKRVAVEMISDTWATTTTDYGIEGEGVQMEQMALGRSLTVLHAQWILVCRAGADFKCRAMMVTRFGGSLGGKTFGRLLQEQELGVPILVRTDVRRYPDGFLAGLGAHLGDRAFVAELDSAAAAQLTDLVGREMSCFNGSARVYHPGWSGSDDPRRHAIWRQREILHEGWDAGFSEHAFRGKIVHEMFTRPREWERERIGEMEEKVRGLEERTSETGAKLAARETELAQVQAKLAGERQRNADLAGENALLEEESRDERGRLQRQIRDLRSRLGRTDRTVQAAVEWATSMFGDRELVFGERVQEGVGALNQNAGPPDKILRYLIQLGEYARAMRSGSVGDIVDWFGDRGCEVSPESPSTARRFRRDFRVNGVVHRFDWHMKPNNRPGAEGVRIHFKWDPDSGKVLVGWVGSHLRTESYGTQ